VGGCEDGARDDAELLLQAAAHPGEDPEGSRLLARDGERDHEPRVCFLVERLGGTKLTAVVSADHLTPGRAARRRSAGRGRASEMREPGSSPARADLHRDSRTLPAGCLSARRRRTSGPTGRTTPFSSTLPDRGYEPRALSRQRVWEDDYAISATPEALHRPYAPDG
jgi:hypothetical protein